MFSVLVHTKKTPTRSCSSTLPATLRIGESEVANSLTIILIVHRVCFRFFVGTRKLSVAQSDWLLSLKNFSNGLRLLPILSFPSESSGGKNKARSKVMTNDPDSFDVPVRGTYGGDYGPETYNVISLPLAVSFKDLWMLSCNSNNPSINRKWYGSRVILDTGLALCTHCVIVNYLCK